MYTSEIRQGHSIITILNYNLDVKYNKWMVVLFNWAKCNITMTIIKIVGASYKENWHGWDCKAMFGS